ncbi:phosphoadenosine phosphosulfate reductase family protein, partial [Salmonella enterica]|uniref:phosphoadenosine phosphosulfate reductase domain-containing protein n=1 Tax=Salmonella enterica TaxID=28901 RepID=UPI00329848ED
MADAVDEIRRYRESHPDVVCSVSWGKDSVVVAHLARRADPTIPIVWVPTIRADGTSYEADATYRVRDTFLAAHPGVYEERPAVATHPKRGDPGNHPDQYDQPGYRPQDEQAEHV